MLTVLILADVLLILTVRAWASGWFESLWSMVADRASVIERQRARAERIAAEADRDLGEPLH